MKKSAFIKNKNISSEILDDSSDDLEKLSDEFNKLTCKVNNNLKKDTQKVINKVDDKQHLEFDITNIYSDINSCLQNYKSIKITGELISFKITDENAWINIKLKEFQISGIFWKITKDKNYPNLKNFKSGDQIVFMGNFNIMKKNLSIYFNIKSMEKVGKGNYLDIYEQYRLKIKELKLKIPKKNLNMFPYTIGIITSSEGAAIQDILQTFKQDKFIGNIIIKNSIVQGVHCPKSIINSIEWFEINYHKQIDLLMITRGGGSWEDLVGFSDWELLIKLSDAKFITLSAVGHQIDNQLTDEVCDYKFATPSIGAKFIVETQLKYHNQLTTFKNSMTKILESYQKNKNTFEKITTNYSNIIYKYDIKNMLYSVKKYRNILENQIDKYSNLKNNFYSKLSQIKPTIIRKKELTSIEDFVGKEYPNKEVGPKKIEIYFVDGRIKISYRITEYEYY